MAQLKFGSAGVTAREIDISGPLTREPSGIPAGIIGTSLKGPAFVPITVGNFTDWISKFGLTDGKKFGPLAVAEWLRNAQSVTYLKVLGIGDGKKNDVTDGKVNNSGFIVGENLPNDDGSLVSNSYAVAAGDAGRVYFLGCFMSESAGSIFFSDAGIQGAGSVTPGVNTALPIIRGILMAPSGVLLRLSSSHGANSSAPTVSTLGTNATALGTSLGSVDLSSGGIPKQEFVLLLNGHKGTDSNYPNVITASFDPQSDSYISKKFNTDPQKIREYGHYLYANWDIYSSLAVVTGSGLIQTSYGAGAANSGNKEPSAFILTSSLGRDVDDMSNLLVPNYESFEDRFSHAVSPWVVSQKFGGTAQNLFRLHSLDDGAGSSTLYKFSIENLTVSTDARNKYSTFDLVVRLFEDRDDDIKKIEVYNGINLDPSSNLYISKAIGDIYAYYDFNREETEQRLIVEGSYENKSKFVRVEVSESVNSGFMETAAIPMGFRGVDHLLTSGSSPMASLGGTDLSLMTTNITASHRSITPPVPFRHKITTATEWTHSEIVNTRLYWGVQFEHPKEVLQKNGSTVANQSLSSFAKYFPQFPTAAAKFITGSNVGQHDTTAWGIIDADRFCNNFFTLENIQVVTGSNSLADTQKWQYAAYCRKGNAGSKFTSEISSLSPGDAVKIRAFKTEDINSNKKYAKFNFFMQGGFNGVNIFDKDEFALNNKAVHGDMFDLKRGLGNGPNVRAYTKALEVMKNTTTVDIQLLAIPGIRHEIVTDAAIIAVEERFDALYIMDIEQKDENNNFVFNDNTVVSVTKSTEYFRDRAVDSSFAAAYFPDVLYRDPGVNTNLNVPPSVLVLGALSLNDKVGHPWFAPAGFARGTLSTAALKARVGLSQNDMDTLYNLSINPIVSFASGGEGMVVWGQKTLQTAASALDRVNVRRLLIDIRRQVREIAQTVLFEPNREATLARFSAAVTPRLQRIQQLSGLERFKVVIDSSTTTQDDIENNTLRGKIFVQPTKTIEFVSLDFVVANNLTQVQ